MNITKFGHSCILLDDGQTKILFDPGMFAELPQLKPDAIIITHVHQDHVDVQKFSDLLKNTPRIITNTQVQEELAKHNIEVEIVEDGSSTTVGTMKIEAFGNDHAIIHPDWPKFQNTSYLINDSVYHPGDALHVPPKPVQFLLLPVVAPWSKMSETLDYIAAVKAPKNFPIHDGFLSETMFYYRLSKNWCDKFNLEFIEPKLGKTYGF